MELNNELSRTYILSKEESAQSVAYALQEYLDRKKNMITQTMRTRNGYMVQCKGDVSAEWTKYLGMDAAVSVTLEQKDDRLTVAITTENNEEWLKAADVDGDGDVTIADLARLQQYLSKKITSF